MFDKRGLMFEKRSIMLDKEVEVNKVSETFEVKKGDFKIYVEKKFYNDNDFRLSIKTRNHSEMFSFVDSNKEVVSIIADLIKKASEL